jgi:osmoprotectant transport system ATP-binding protein
VIAVDFQGVTVVRSGAPVLKDLTLRVNAGEVLALVGRSGAGKTTALKLVNRLLLPTSGQVIVGGTNTRDWDAIRLRRSTGYVIQDAGLFPHLSVADNIAVVPRLLAWDPQRIEARTVELLQLVGLTPARYAGRWPDELSGGERQRVGVARALAGDPQLLLMDEPFGALDPISRSDLQGEFQQIQERLGKTVLIVTHDIAEALLLADRIAVLDAGMLVTCEHPQTLVRSGDPRVRRMLDAVRVPVLQ